MANTAYENKKTHNQLKNKGGVAVIRSRGSRVNPQFHDKHHYQERHLIECLFNKIMFYHFDNLTESFLSFIYFVAALIWLHYIFYSQTLFIDIRLSKTVLNLRVNQLKDPNKRF